MLAFIEFNYEKPFSWIAEGASKNDLVEVHNGQTNTELPMISLNFLLAQPLALSKNAPHFMKKGSLYEISKSAQESPNLPSEKRS